MTGWIGKTKVTKDYVDKLGYRHITIDGKEYVFTWNAQPNSRATEQKMHPTDGRLTTSDSRKAYRRKRISRSGKRKFTRRSF